MNNKTIGFAVVLGAILLLSRRGQAAPGAGSFTPGQSYVPPRPNRQMNPQAFQQWVNSILATYGAVSALWQPGGPFHNDPNVDFQEYTQMTWTDLF